MQILRLSIYTDRRRIFVITYLRKNTVHDSIYRESSLFSNNSPADQSLAKNMSKNWELKDEKKSMTTCSSGKLGIWRNEFFSRVG